MFVAVRCLILLFSTDALVKVNTGLSTRRPSGHCACAGSLTAVHLTSSWRSGDSRQLSHVLITCEAFHDPDALLLDCVHCEGRGPLVLRS
jgi:hypothetical protein